MLSYFFAGHFGTCIDQCDQIWWILAPLLKVLKVFRIFCRFHLLFGKILNQFCQKYFVWTNFMVVNCHMWTNNRAIWSHWFWRPFIDCVRRFCYNYLPNETPWWDIYLVFEKGKIDITHIILNQVEPECDVNLVLLAHP